jgi:hypothetical protein
VINSGDEIYYREYVKAKYGQYPVNDSAGNQSRNIYCFTYTNKLLKAVVWKVTKNFFEGT